MGQQQLLLLVLGIVIVGLAVVVGIQSFEENQQKSTYDSHTVEAINLATKIVAWQQKPTAMGGNRGGSDLAAVRLSQLGYGQDAANGA